MIEEDERFRTGSLEGADGWTGGVEVRRGAGGRPYFVPQFPKALGKLDAVQQEVVSDLQGAVARVQQAQQDLEDLIVTARDAGVSWRLIGWTLGLSGEAVQQRWARTAADNEPV